MLDSVYMMNVLMFFEKSSEVLFHYKTMLQYVIIFINKWMILRSNQYIPGFVNSFSAFPTRVAFPESVAHLKRCSAMLRAKLSVFYETLGHKLEIFKTFRAIFNQSNHIFYYSK